jgi:hypothetical protein
MPTSERPWEAKAGPDGEVSRSARAAIGIAFLGTVILTMIVIGFSLPGAIAGTILGIIVIIGLSKLVAWSNRSRSDGPPPQLL